MKPVRIPLFIAAFLAATSCFAQQSITSIVTSTSTVTPVVSYTGVKGAGLRNSAGTLGSNWDSTGSNFTLNFNSGVNNVTSITQFSVTGHINPLTPMSTSAVVKVRRLANT